MQAYIDRAQEVNPIVNAIIADRYGDALKEAEKVDEILDSKKNQGKYSAVNAPFLGVPLSVKEAFGVKGIIKSISIFGWLFITIIHKEKSIG